MRAEGALEAHGARLAPATGAPPGLHAAVPARERAPVDTARPHAAQAEADRAGASAHALGLACIERRAVAEGELQARAAARAGDLCGRDQASAAVDAASRRRERALEAGRAGERRAVSVVDVLAERVEARASRIPEVREPEDVLHAAQEPIVVVGVRIDRSGPDPR